MIFLFDKRKQEDNPSLFPFKPKVLTVEELCSGKNADVRKVLENNKRRRLENNYTTKGWTKKKTMRHIMDVPMEVYFHPELGKYFQRGQDRHERKKNRYLFLKKYPEFKTVEKL